MVERLDRTSAYRAYGVSNGGVRSSARRGSEGEDPGVYFELSDALKAEEKEKEDAIRPASLRTAPEKKTTEPQMTVAETKPSEGIKLPDFKKLAGNAGAFFKKLGARISSLISSFWNGEKLGTGAAEASAEEGSEAVEAFAGNLIPETEAAAEASRRTGSVISGEVEYLPKTTDVKAIRNYMKDYGGRHLAVNSDLLTSYDRHGRLVQHDPSDADKLLRQNADQLIDTGRKNK